MRQLQSSQIQWISNIIEDPRSFQVSALHPKYLAFAQDDGSSFKYLILMHFVQCGKKEDTCWNVHLFDQWRLCQKPAADFPYILLTRIEPHALPKSEGNGMSMIDYYNLPPKAGEGPSIPWYTQLLMM